MSKIVCSVDRCAGVCIARGLCWKHYRRQLRYGNVEFARRRYNLRPRCKYCGETEPDSFYPHYKSICKRCKKLKAARRRLALTAERV